MVSRTAVNAQVSKKARAGPRRASVPATKTTPRRTPAAKRRPPAGEPTADALAATISARLATENDPPAAANGKPAERTVMGLTVVAEHPVTNLPNAPFRYQMLELSDGTKLVECLDCPQITAERGEMVLHRRAAHGASTPAPRKRGAGHAAALPEHIGALSLYEVVDILRTYTGLGDYIERIQAERDAAREKAMAVDRKYTRLIRALEKAGLSVKVEDD